MQDIPDELVPIIIKKLSVPDFFHFSTTAQKFYKFVNKENIWEYLFIRDYSSDVIVISSAKPTEKRVKFAVSDYKMRCPSYKCQYQNIDRYLKVQIFDERGQVGKTILARKGKGKYPVDYISRFLTLTYRSTPICQFLSSGLWVNLSDWIKGGNFYEFLTLQILYNVKYIGADKIRLLKEPPTNGQNMTEVISAAYQLLLNFLAYERNHQEENSISLETQKKLFEELIH